MVPDIPTLMAALRAEHAGQGNAAFGIATAGPSQTQDRFRQWIDRGIPPGIDYLKRHIPLRADPDTLLSGVRSILAIAAPYPVNPDPAAGISTYARCRDYHDILRARLRRFARIIEQHDPGTKCRTCVDSAPLAEREWALRAGLGWRGRQGHLVTASGCSVVLGFLLTRTVLPPTGTIPDQCGTCTRCRDACPTQAIGRDGLINPSRCISYLTIEHSGDIPESFHTAIGRRLFGCDCCTASCPWNRQSDHPPSHDFAFREMPSAHDLLAMDDTTFKARYADTPLIRAGLKRLQRNAAIVIRNT
ncbi:MAG: tRNA epoxyqueuosine(34) reductase QueG [Lentisphaerae bacterium RIFOXYC12_FULL_60_16]|nr:MAG: tRNA epoxyqueuosine(34) reductase QueG [Lentisphaerae bacterium RIFOXYC12_FULL_60_16]OGV75695.1 MAG: tRNA epoxyqueuosine(34) reductase QueG [Lentisphaerae bacterium RIFOXYB12_FULL_60_10]